MNYALLNGIWLHFVVDNINYDHINIRILFYILTNIIDESLVISWMQDRTVDKNEKRRFIGSTEW